MGGCKKQKIYHEQETGDTEDVISGLPDCILSHILSFLPTKDAVGTCVLSTRWRDLWAGLPNIDLDDRLVYFSNFGNRDLSDRCMRPFEYVPFLNFVERVLIHRNISYMTRFRLSCRVCFCPSRVGTWISSAIKRNVKELDLFLELGGQFHLPHCVFNCKSLRVLKIDMECALILPQTVSLPNLRNLYLGTVGFLDDHSAWKLFSGCPSLEELCLLDCDWGLLKSITISIPTLKRLRIDDLPFWGSPNTTSGCMIKVQAPRLVSFEYLGDLPNEILLDDPSSLTEVSVFTLDQREWKFNFNPQNICHVFKLFKGLHNVKVLRISASTIGSLSAAERFLGRLPVFQKLTHMELSLENDSAFQETLLKFLLNIPHLEFLAFHEELVPNHMQHHEDVYILAPTSRCNLPRLKSIDLHFVHGFMADMHVLKYLVENAPVLGRISMFCSGNLSIDPKKKKEIMRKVEMLLNDSRESVAVLPL